MKTKRGVSSFIPHPSSLIPQRGGLAQFGKHPERALGVEERNPHVMGAGAGDLVDHAQPGLLQLSDPVFDARDGEGDMVQPLASLLQEGRDRTGWVGRFQQFEPDLAKTEEANTDLLVGNYLDALEHCSKGALVE